MAGQDLKNNITGTWAGSWAGAASGNTTINAIIVGGTGPWTIINEHIKKVGAIQIGGKEPAALAATVASFNDTANIGGYTEYFEPAVVRIRGPSTSCIATPMRIEGYAVKTAAYTQAADWVIKAVVAFAAPRTHLSITIKDCEWIRDGAGDSSEVVQAAASAIRLASRIIAASKSDYNDPYARKAANREFDIAAAALAKLISTK